MFSSGFKNIFLELGTTCMWMEHTLCFSPTLLKYSGCLLSPVCPQEQIILPPPGWNGPGREAFEAQNEKKNTESDITQIDSIYLQGLLSSTMKWSWGKGDKQVECDKHRARLKLGTQQEWALSPHAYVIALLAGGSGPPSIWSTHKPKPRWEVSRRGLTVKPWGLNSRILPCRSPLESWEFCWEL